MGDAEHIFSIADHHAQTVQVCIDRLQELGANEQLKRLTGRLQKLAARATPVGLGANVQNLKGQPVKRATDRDEKAR
jgi:hypothetical protein